MAIFKPLLKKILESSNTEEGIRCGIAAFLIIGIFLPNTLWALFSIQQFLPWLNNISSAKPLPYYSITSYLMGMAILFSYVIPIKTCSIKASAKIGYWACFIFLAWILGEYGYSGYNDIACLSAFNYLCIGLAAVKICGSSKRFFQLVVCLGTMQAFYTIGYYINSVNILISGTVSRAGGVYDNPQQVYFMMLFCIPAALTLALTSVRAKWLWYICFTILSAAIMTTWFRGGILAAGIGLSYFLYSGAAKKKTVTAAMVFLMIITISPFIYRSNGHVNKLSTTRSISGRYLLWNTGTQILKKNWITGIGLHRTRIPVTTSAGKAQVFTHPLNLYLHILMEFGIRGAILLCLAIIGTALVLKQKQKYAKEEALALGAVWISLLVAGLFDTPVLTTAYLITYTMFGAFFGMTIACPPKNTIAFVNAHENDLHTEPLLPAKILLKQ